MTDPDPDLDLEQAAVPTRQLRLSWGGATHQGRVRTTNQDALFADRGLFIVADGMGGHQGGEVASQIAVRTMAGAGHGSLDELVAAVESSNKAVWEYAEDKPDLKGMGTTLTGIAVLGDGRPPRFGVVNVGDSRIYRVRDGAIEQITDDHSYVAELVRRGQLSEEDSHTHPYRNMLTRAIGVADSIDVDTWEIDPIAGDKFVLCSDGLVNELEDHEILEVFDSAGDPSELAQTLIEGANNAGGKDNVTVVAVYVEVDDVPAPVIEPSEPDAAPTTSDTGMITPIEDTAAIPVIEPIADEAEPAILDTIAESSDPLFSEPVHEDELPIVTERSDALADFELPALDNESPLPWLADAAGPEGETELRVDAVFDHDDDSVKVESEVSRSPQAQPPQDSDPKPPSAPTAPDNPTVQFLDTAVAPDADADIGPAKTGWQAPVAVTWRALALIGLAIAALVSAFAITGLYARGSYHVAFAGDEVVIYQGRSGGVLWFDPTLEEGSGIFRSQIPDAIAADIDAIVESGSLEAARVFVDEIRPVATTDAAASGDADLGDADDTEAPDENPDDTTDS